MRPFHEVLRELALEVYDEGTAEPAPVVPVAPSAPASSLFIGGDAGAVRDQNPAPELEPGAPVLIYLESVDVARVLGTSAAAIKSFAARGLLRSSACTVRGVQLYSAVDVAAFIENRKRPEAGAAQ